MSVYADFEPTPPAPNSRVMSIVPIALKLKVKGTKELKAMGVSGGAKIRQKGVYSNSFDFHQLEFDDRIGSRILSGWHAREKRLRIAVEYLEFDFEKFRLDNAEYFV